MEVAAGYKILKHRVAAKSAEACKWLGGIPAEALQWQSVLLIINIGRGETIQILLLLSLPDGTTVQRNHLHGSHFRIVIKKLRYLFQEGGNALQVPSFLALLSEGYESGRVAMLEMGETIFQFMSQ